MKKKLIGLMIIIPLLSISSQKDENNYNNNYPMDQTEQVTDYLPPEISNFYTESLSLNSYLEDLINNTNPANMKAYSNSLIERPSKAIKAFIDNANNIIFSGYNFNEYDTREISQSLDSISEKISRFFIHSKLAPVQGFTFKKSLESIKEILTGIEPTSKKSSQFSNTFSREPEILAAREEKKEILSENSKFDSIDYPDNSNISDGSMIQDPSNFKGAFKELISKIKDFCDNSLFIATHNVITAYQDDLHRCVEGINMLLTDFIENYANIVDLNEYKDYRDEFQVYINVLKENLEKYFPSQHYYIESLETAAAKVNSLPVSNN
ncbi:MAG: hypothetical protein ACXWL5_03940 [Candidatus Chromulinivorax sp.]